MCPANRAALMGDTMSGYIASAIFDLRSQIELKELERIPHRYALVLATPYDVLKGLESVQSLFQDSQALGGRPIDLLETGRDRAGQGLLNANAVI